jgi:hypothetical protein
LRDAAQSYVIARGVVQLNAVWSKKGKGVVPLFPFS